MTSPDLRRHALVTGATSGIGYRVATGLLEEGYAVFLTGRNARVLGEMVAAAEEGGGSAFSLACDLSLPGEVTRLIDRTMEALGGRVDLLVNNAGLLTFGPIEDTTLEEFEQLMAVNVRAPFMLSRAILPRMKEHGTGLIVNISSIAGIESWAGNSLYSMTKFAIRGLTGSLQAEGAPFGVKAVAICPGYVATPMVEGASVPLQEMIQPEDLLKTIRYLRDLSPAAVSGDLVLKRLGSL